MTHDDLRSFYGQQLSTYRELFGSMDDVAKAVWFFVADEGDILSFIVAPGESAELAGFRHGVKLAAMAEALESCCGFGERRGQVADLRRLAAQHGYRFE